MEWNVQNTILLIKYFKEKRELWDSSYVDFKDRYKKQEAWKDLAQKLKTDKNVIERKVRSLSGQFQRELRKHGRPGAATDEITSKWYGFRLLLFLKDANKVRSTNEASFFEDDSQPSKPKRFKSGHFSQVMKACIQLVKLHGRPISLFDDAAFKDLINCIPLTNKEKQTITSEYIQALIDNNEESSDDSTDMDVTADHTYDDSYVENEIPMQNVVKCELTNYNCAKNSDQAVEKHDPTCLTGDDVPQQTYWNFFEVSMDVAKCNICNNTITWSTITKLKEHLQTHHPDVEFLDDDDDFQKGPPSSVGSREDVEEIYLDAPLKDPIKSSAKKRKKAKLAMLRNKPVKRENIASSFYWFKSLDIFGTYVASLMKQIPKDKCRKLQVQIVEKLLQEQASAA